MHEKVAAAIAWLARQAALSSHSKRIKLRDGSDQQKASKALKEATGNTRSPYRYGRKLPNDPRTKSTPPEVPGGGGSSAPGGNTGGDA